MTTHLFAPPGDFPSTLCGIPKAWGGPGAVYFCDLDRVDCPECLDRVEIPTGEPYIEEPTRGERRLVAMCCAALVGTFALIAYLWWLAT